MKIKIWEIEKSKQSFKFEYTEDLSHLVKDSNQLISITPIHVKGEAYKTSGLFIVKGNVSSELQFQCSRCLNNYTYNLDNKFEELFIPEGIEMDFADGEENLHQLKSDEIDLKQIVEETVILGIPYIPVCSEECIGLCPSCGINLNVETCECKLEKVDVRLADLSKWFDQNDTTE